MLASQVELPVYESNAREIALDPVSKLIDEIIAGQRRIIRGECNATAKPLEGAQLGHYDHCAVARDVHAGAGFHYRQRSDPDHCRQPCSSLSQGTWVITSFGVANAISIPITGWLAKRVGEVKLFL